MIKCFLYLVLPQGRKWKNGVLTIPLREVTQDEVRSTSSGSEQHTNRNRPGIRSCRFSYPGTLPALVHGVYGSQLRDDVEQDASFATADAPTAQST